jgi:hypothetical protein
MQKGILYMLLFTYSTLILKPVMPYVSDAVAHVFWYSKHMATVHYVNGKFHVHREMMEAAKQSNKEKTPYLEKKEQGQNVHVIGKIMKLDFVVVLIDRYYYSTSATQLFGHLTHDYPPPKI